MLKLKCPVKVMGYAVESKGTTGCEIPKPLHCSNIILI
jgi:hypothetical protein